MNKHTGRLSRIFHSTLVRVTIIIIIILIGIRVALPYVLLHIANSQLQDIPGYRGHIGDIDLHLLRGYYQLQNIEVYWHNAPSGKAEPIFRAQSINVLLFWSKLFKGRIVGSSAVILPNVSVFEKMLTAPPKTKKGKPLPVIFRNMLPIRIDEFLIKNGTVHMKNYTKAPNFDLYIKNLQVHLYNLTNMQNLKKPTYATMIITGTVLESGSLKIKVLFDPVSTTPNLYVQTQLLGLDVTKLNEFANHYANLDFNKGTFSLASEVTVKNGKMDGYAKPVYKDLEVFSWSKDIKKNKTNVLKDFWEAIAGAVSEGFENQKHDQLAARVPIKGSLSGPKTDFGSALGSVFQNIFSHAIMPTIEHTVKPPNKK